MVEEEVVETDNPEEETEAAEPLGGIFDEESSAPPEEGTPAPDSDDEPAEAPKPTDEEEPKEEGGKGGEEPEKKEEETTAPPKGDVDWEKRHADSQIFIEETSKKNTALEGTLKSQGEELALLREALEKENIEVPEGKKEELTTEGDSPEDAAFVSRIRLSEKIVKPVYKDYGEIVGSDADKKPSPFKQAVEANPALLSRVRAAENPALEAYQIGKDYNFHKKYGSEPEEIRATIEKEIREKVIEEQKLEKQKLKSSATPPLRTVPSLKDVQGTEQPSIDTDESLVGVFGGR